MIIGIKNREEDYMLSGFDNEFVLTNIFGKTDVFIGAEIDNIQYRPLGFVISMEIITKSEVINPPSKWKTWDSPPKWKTWDAVCMYVDLSGVKEFETKVTRSPLEVEEFTVTKDGLVYSIEIVAKNNTRMFIKSYGGHIHRIIPVKYREGSRGYDMV